MLDLEGTRLVTLSACETGLGDVRNGVVKGNIVLEDRSPIPGADPVTGLPRIEFEYCFVGQDFELRRK